MSQFLKKYRLTDRQISEWTKENGSLETGAEHVCELEGRSTSTQDGKEGEAKKQWQWTTA